MRYKIYLEAINEDPFGDTTVISQRYLSAEQTIEAMVWIERLSARADVVDQRQGDYSQGDAPDFEFAVEEEEPEPAPKRKKSGKPADATEPIERLSKSHTRAPRGCSKCGQLGHNARTCSGPKTGDGLTEYERRKHEKEAEAPDEDPTLAEVAKMAAEGLSQAELQMMFPSVPMYEIIKAWERHNHI